MCTKCLWVFLAGAATFHALGHLFLAFSSLLPLHMWGFTITTNINYVIIAASVAVAGIFLYLASETPCECKVR